MVTEIAVPIRLFIIGHQPIVILGLKKLFESAQPSMKIVGIAPNCKKAFELLRKKNKRTIDIIFLDVDSNLELCLNTIPELLKASKARLLAFNGIHNKQECEKFMLAGAMGVIDKYSPIEKIVDAINKVHRGELWLDRETTGKIFLELAREYKEGAMSKSMEDSHLTKREKEIIAFLAQHTETSIRNIANLMSISEHTLRNHLTSIYNKIEPDNRLALFVYAQKHGLVSSDSDDKDK